MFRAELADEAKVLDMRTLPPEAGLPAKVVARLDEIRAEGFEWVVLHQGPIEGRIATVYVRVRAPAVTDDLAPFSRPPEAE